MWNNYFLSSKIINYRLKNVTKEERRVSSINDKNSEWSLKEKVILCCPK